MGSPGIRVVQQGSQNGAGKSSVPVGDVGAVPLFSAHIEAASQIGHQSHKAAVRTFHRHIGEGSLLRKIDLDPMGILVWRAHQIVSLAQQTEHLVHHFDTARHILGPSLNSLLLCQKQKIKLSSILNSPFLCCLRFSRKSASALY